METEFFFNKKSKSPFKKIYDKTEISFFLYYILLLLLFNFLFFLTD